MVLEQGGSFLFYRTEAQSEVVLGGIVVVAVFQVTVVQIVMAEGYGLYMFSGVVPVRGSYGECFLMDGGQVA